MNLAYVSLAALVIAILVSCFTELNVGILALALAWIVGVYVGGMPLNEVIGGFPVSLFLTLAGVTLLFTQAQLNGTLDRIAHRAVRICRGNAGLIPVDVLRAGCGAGVAGAGKRIDRRAAGADGDGGCRAGGHPAFLMIIMVGNGAQAGRSVAVRADRRHRQRPDGEDRPARPRVAHLLDESRGPRARRVRRLRRCSAG